MLNVRIGNDIRVNFGLRSIENYDRVNVKQMRCYFINTTRDEDQIEDSTNCPCNRFPREPFPQFYTPTKYKLNCCGAYTYHVHPSNSKCCYANSSSCNDYHIWAGYNGFGINPHKFSDCVINVGAGDYEAPVEYLAYAHSNNTGDISAYFPASQQRMCGIYKMIVVLTMYEEGWGKNNFHTYTFDYGVVFNIVDDETGESGNVVIEVDKFDDFIVVDLPSNLLNNSSTYNGQNQTFLPSNWNSISEYCTVSGNTNTNVGSYTLVVSFKAGRYQWADGTKEAKTFTYNITKANDVLVSAPTANNNVANGEYFSLVTRGTTKYGAVIQYKLGINGTYSHNIPTESKVGTYDVYYKIDGNQNYNGVAETKVTTTLSQADKVYFGKTFPISLTDMVASSNNNNSANIVLKDGIFSVTPSGEYATTGTKTYWVAVPSGYKINLENSQSPGEYAYTEIESNPGTYNNNVVKDTTTLTGFNLYKLTRPVQITATLKINVYR